MSHLLFFFFHASRHHQDLPSFPTRRSSDLRRCNGNCSDGPTCGSCASAQPPPSHPGGKNDHLGGLAAAGRSEEHTSELQSRFDLVCRLLLEKKKILRR